MMFAPFPSHCLFYSNPLLLADQLESIYTPEVPVGDGSDADYALVKKLAKIATTQYNGRVHTVLKVSPKQAYMQRTTVRESNICFFWCFSVSVFQAIKRKRLSSVYPVK